MFCLFAGWYTEEALLENRTKPTSDRTVTKVGLDFVNYRCFNACGGGLRCFVA